MLHAVVAVLLLLTATVLAVYKPVGATAYGRRKELDEGRRSTPIMTPERRAAPTNASPSVRQLLNNLRDSKNEVAEQPVPMVAANRESVPLELREESSR